MYVSMKDILIEADRCGYAVPAINCINMEMVRGAISAAIEEHAAVIINIGVGQMRNHGHPEEMVPMIISLAKRADVPVALNLDHGSKLDDVCRCIKWGFSSVMIDASELPLEANINHTRAVCALAQPLNICVEGELGHVGQTTNGDDENQDLYTAPDQAMEFVRRTGVDALAVAIGTAHGNYPHHKIPHLDFDRLQELKATLKMPLVLHGGSGAGDENLTRAVACGINKVNICTDAFQNCKDAFLSAYKENPSADYMHLCMATERSMKAFTIHYLRVLGASDRYGFDECLSESSSAE